MSLPAAGHPLLIIVYFCIPAGGGPSTTDYSINCCVPAGGGPSITDYSILLCPCRRRAIYYRLQYKLLCPCRRRAISDTYIPSPIIKFSIKNTYLGSNLGMEIHDLAYVLNLVCIFGSLFQYFQEYFVNEISIMIQYKRSNSRGY